MGCPSAPSLFLATFHHSFPQSIIVPHIPRTSSLVPHLDLQSLFAQFGQLRCTLHGIFSRICFLSFCQQSCPASSVHSSVHHPKTRKQAASSLGSVYLVTRWTSELVRLKSRNADRDKEKEKESRETKKEEKDGASRAMDRPVCGFASTQRLRLGCDHDCNSNYECECTYV